MAQSEGRPPHVSTSHRFSRHRRAVPNPRTWLRARSARICSQAANVYCPDAAERMCQRKRENAGLIHEPSLRSANSFNNVSDVRRGCAYRNVLLRDCCGIRSRTGPTGLEGWTELDLCKRRPCLAHFGYRPTRQTHPPHFRRPLRLAMEILGEWAAAYLRSRARALRHDLRLD